MDRRTGKKNKKRSGSFKPWPFFYAPKKSVKTNRYGGKADDQNAPEDFLIWGQIGKARCNFSAGLKIGKLRAMCEIGHGVEEELFVLKTRRIEILVFEHFRTADQ